jgi:hypothetical protein
MTDQIQGLLQRIGELAVASPDLPEPGEWDALTITVRAMRSYVEQDAVYAHSEKQVVPVTFFIDDELPYEQQVTPSFERLRQLMYEQAPFRGAWYTAVMKITADGDFDTEFEYDEKPAFDHLSVGEAFAQDFEHFPRNEASTPDWLKPVVQQFGLAYPEA